MRVKKLDYGQVEYICEQLSMMIGSGIGAADGMELLCDDIPDGTLKAACMEISGAVSKGESLSAAVRSTGRFPEYAADMISVGEMSGKLEEVLRGLAEYYDERDDIRRALRSAVLHPMVLLLMMTVVMIVLVVMVIPMFGDIFSQFDSSVSGTVKNTVELAYNSGIVIMIVLLALIVISAVIAIMSRLSKTGGFVRRLASALPFTRGIAEKLSLCDLTKAVSINVSAGISPEDMIMRSNIRSFIRDRRVAERYSDCEKRVINGESFPDAVLSSRLLPPLYARSLKLAYSSGSFESVWKRISSNYHEETQRSLMNLTAVIEPAMIVILGLLIGAILLMLMIPMMNIMSVLG